MEYPKLNVFGEELQLCCLKPVTGWYRDGFCRTDIRDRGSHTVCGHITQPFLDFSKSMGNDLETPMPEFNFPGLKPGDKWCICAVKWLETQKAGFACPVYLESTHQRALEVIPFEVLRRHRVE